MKLDRLALVFCVVLVSLGIYLVALETARPAEAQSVAACRSCLNVKYVPDPEDLRSFSLSLTMGQPVDIFTVPAGQVFVITDVIMDPGASPSGEVFRENGVDGPIRARFAGGQFPGGAVFQVMSPQSGIMYREGSTVTVVRTGPGDGWITVCGYLADAR